ncbi:MAG: CapA family protein [Bacteroidales bacterium]
MDRLAHKVPGKSAVRLIIKDVMPGIDYISWLRRQTNMYEVDCWVKELSENRLEVILAGHVQKLEIVARAAWESTKASRGKKVKEKWFVKSNGYNHEKKNMMIVTDTRKKITKSEGKQFTITFAGNTTIGGYYLGKRKNESCIERLEDDPFSTIHDLKPLIENSDHLILNLNTALTKSTAKPHNLENLHKNEDYYNWGMAERIVPVLKHLGVTAVNRANKNTAGFGAELMLETCRHLQEAGIESFGAGTNINEASKPLQIVLKGESSTLKAYVFAGMWVSRPSLNDNLYFADDNNAGVNIFSLRKMTESVIRLREKEPDALIIVCPHWQEFNYEKLSPKIKNVCRSLIVAGANFVFAHGGPMADSIEKTDKGVIAFSIGNFLVNSSDNTDSPNGLPYSFVVKLKVSENKQGWFLEPCFYPIVAGDKTSGFNLRMVTRNEYGSLYQYLNLKNDNSNGFTTIIKKKTDRYGRYYTVDNRAECISLKEVIFDEHYSGLDYKDVRLVDCHIDQLERLQNETDKALSIYYDKLFRIKLMQNKQDTSVLFLSKLGKIVKKEHINNYTLVQFETKNLNIKKAISFKEIMIEKSETRRLGFPEYSWKLFDKYTAYRFADNIGVRRPKNSLQTYRFSEIEQQEGPVVIKPVYSSDSKGVYLILNKNHILSAKEGMILNNWTELQQHVLREAKTGLVDKIPSIRIDQWFIEELITGPEGIKTPASNLKFYAFYGEVLFVSESNPAYYRKFFYWDPEMNPIETGRHDNTFYEGSGFSESDVELAKSVSLKIPTPFIRIDMLKGRDGLYLGELTPRPGQFHLFNEEYDRKMGEAFRRAEAKLTKDLLNGKDFNEFKSLIEI